MNLQTGSILKSTAKLTNTVFEGVYILVVEYNGNGAVGFIFNKPYGRSLHHLEEFSQVPPFGLYHGGPVDEEHLYFIHRRPDVITEGVEIGKNIFWGGNFSQVVEGIASGKLTSNDVKIFAGYCGWDKGELEAELGEESWILVHEQTPIFE